MTLAQLAAALDRIDILVSLAEDQSHPWTPRDRRELNELWDAVELYDYDARLDRGR